MNEKQAPESPIALNSGVRTSDSAFAMRVKLSELIDQGSYGVEVLEYLLPNGIPHLFEKSMWDYKEELPKPTQGRSDERYNIKMAEVVKDVIAFYNSYGGYLIVGVADEPRRVVGYSSSFDCGDLAKKVKGATGVDVDCHYKVVRIAVHGGETDVGILQIPKRQEGVEPAQFHSNAPDGPTGKRAYKRQDIYLRMGDESRPAISSEDFSFLCSEGRRRITITPKTTTSRVENNLSARDPSFVQFVGRKVYLEILWKWFCDRYSAVKVVAGLGGLGKTTIAREFAEELLHAAPVGLHKVVWLSAKRQFYAAILGKYVAATRVDFNDLQSLLRSLLLELGSHEGELDDDTPRETLIELTIDALKLFPSLVIVDDIDTLGPDEQSDVFQTLVMIMNRTIDGHRSGSRALLTARLDLGAAPGQLIRLSGLDLDEFSEYVKITAESIGLPFKANRAKMNEFHRDAGGSPTFASSILRLLQSGEELGPALKKWRGSDGEDVRRFAFQRELEGLTDSQIRTLYALCLLGESSHAELQHVLQGPEGKLRDDIGELRKFHLISLSGDLPVGGARLQIPGVIQLMRDVIRPRIIDPTRIEQDCGRVREASPRLGLDVGRIVGHVIDLWRQDDVDNALEVARIAHRKSPKNADVACLLGRAYMKKRPPNYRHAEAAFRTAHELGCSRPELYALWCEAKQNLNDWSGLIELTRRADSRGSNGDLVWLRANCYLNLGESAAASGNSSRAAEYYRDGGKDIASVFKRQLARIRVAELRELRNVLMGNYVRIVDRMTLNPRDQLNVWSAVVEAYECYVRSPSLVRLGVQRLQSWWDAVCFADDYHEKAAELMRIQLGRLEMIVETTKKFGQPDAELVEELEHKKTVLTAAWRSYLQRLNGS